MTKVIPIAANQTRPAVLDGAAAAAYLGVQSRTLRLWRRTKGVPHIKLSSKCIRYRQADIDRWLDQHAVQLRGGSR